MNLRTSDELIKMLNKAASAHREGGATLTMGLDRKVFSKIRTAHFTFRDKNHGEIQQISLLSSYISPRRPEQNYRTKLGPSKSWLIACICSKL